MEDEDIEEMAEEIEEPASEPAKPKKSFFDAVRKIGGQAKEKTAEWKQKYSANQERKRMEHRANVEEKLIRLKSENEVKHLEHETRLIERENRAIDDEGKSSNSARSAFSAISGFLSSRGGGARRAQPRSGPPSRMSIPNYPSGKMVNPLARFSQNSNFLGNPRMRSMIEGRGRTSRLPSMLGGGLRIRGLGTGMKNPLARFKSGKRGRF